ncbi:MAG: hypothetical protein D6725_07880, partial [Planctomycetota bacterium]
SLCVAVAAPVHGSDRPVWNRFRGPNGSGVAEGRAPAKWSDSDYLWNATLPGAGHSSPVGGNGTVYVTAADAERGRRFLIALSSRNGSVRWSVEHPFTPKKKHKNNSYASNTPACDADAVYFLQQDRDGSSLTAYDHQGKRLWRADLGPYNHGQGSGTSPIVYQDLVIVANDHGPGSFLAAFDRRTGEQRWRIPREGKRACYATPCVYRPGDRPAEIVFVHSFEGIIGVDPFSGAINWHVDVFGRDPQRAVGSPVTAGSIVVATSGAVAGAKQLVAIRTRRQSDGVAAEVLYHSRKGPHVPTPLIVGENRLFQLLDIGIAVWSDLETGRPIWQKRIGGTYFSSPICVGGAIYCPDVDGHVVVLAASDTFRELGRSELPEGTKATPAVIDGRLIFRTESRVVALPLKR